MVRHCRQSIARRFPAALILACVLASTAMADTTDTDSAINIGKHQTVRGHTHGQPKLAVAMGKNSPLYLLNRDNLGKTAPNDAGALQAIALPGSDYKGGPAYYAGPNGPYVYIQRDSSPLMGLSLSAGSKPQLTKRLKGTTIAGYGGSFPIVSSNGAVAGTGVVWLVRRAQTVQLEAYDALHLGAPIYTAAAGNWLNPNNNAFVSPLEANGRVYVPAYRTVTVFGLTP